MPGWAGESSFIKYFIEGDKHWCVLEAKSLGLVELPTSLLPPL